MNKDTVAEYISGRRWRSRRSLFLFFSSIFNLEKKKKNFNFLRQSRRRPFLCIIVYILYTRLAFFYLSLSLFQTLCYFHHIHFVYNWFLFRRSKKKNASFLFSLFIYIYIYIRISPFLFYCFSKCIFLVTSWILLIF